MQILAAKSFAPNSSSTTSWSSGLEVSACRASATTGHTGRENSAWLHLVLLRPRHHQAACGNRNSGQNFALKREQRHVVDMRNLKRCGPRSVGRGWPRVCFPPLDFQLLLHFSRRPFLANLSCLWIVVSFLALSLFIDLVFGVCPVVVL